MIVSFYWIVRFFIFISEFNESINLDFAYKLYICVFFILIMDVVRWIYYYNSWIFLELFEYVISYFVNS